MTSLWMYAISIKIAMMEYVVPLEEKQQGVAHRAARYYKFDKKIYNKVRR